MFSNEILLNSDTSVRIIYPNRDLEYYEEHITRYLGFIGNVISIRGYTCTVRIKSGDSESFIPIHRDALEVIDV